MESPHTVSVMMICFHDIFNVTFAIHKIKPFPSNSRMCRIKNITNIVTKNPKAGFLTIDRSFARFLQQEFDWPVFPENRFKQYVESIWYIMVKALLNASEADLVPVFGNPAEIIFILISFWYSYKIVWTLSNKKFLPTKILFCRICYTNCLWVMFIYENYD